VRCAFCQNEMAYVHGHAACIASGCPMYGVNQGECCDGETAEAAPVRTSDIAVAPARTSQTAAAPGASVETGDPRSRPARRAGK
jgi:hypothetical protein